ncbi:MAG TPA: hypothetical protein VN844_06445 [Pyrinomonadaceae bacterium]|nr:hypothetical protein [Pyrinomonadaceae bacterium]
MTTLATTNPQEAKVAEPVNCACPLPAYNGRLVKHSQRPEIYLIVNGYRRHVLNVDVVNTLFVTNRTVKDEDLVDLIAQGPDIGTSAGLVQGNKSDPWYFLPGDNTKMWIRDETTFAQYQFRKVRPVDQSTVDQIPSGPDLEGRTD